MAAVKSSDLDVRIYKTMYIYTAFGISDALKPYKPESLSAKRFFVWSSMQNFLPHENPEFSLYGRILRSRAKTERALSILFSSVWWFLVYEIFMQKET